MDRAGRRYSIASSVIAVPMVLLMATFSTGDSPATEMGAVQHAVPQRTDEPATESSPIQQVVGKQPHPRKTRPGLLEVLAGSATTGNKNHSHKNMGKTQSRGLLDGVFGTTKKSVDKRDDQKSRKQASHRTKRTTQQPAKRQASVNWDGIPYHAPVKADGRSSKTPVQDPTPAAVVRRSEPRTSGSSNTRIIRGGSNRVTNALPASSRINPKSRTARQEPTAASLPKPPADVTPSLKKAPRFSSTSSSRRSGRRELNALEASIERKPTKTSNESESAEDDVVALVPKAAVKPVPKSAEEAAKDQVAANEKSPSESTDESNVASDDAGGSQSPSPNTALAAIGSPTAAPEPESAGDTVPSEPAAASEANGDYTIPVDPASAPIPTAGIPHHPYAASTPPVPTSPSSTPASAVSHRSGPPSSAFKNTPIGSGVVPDSDVAANGQASEPVYQTAQRPGSTTDPYGARGHFPSNRLTTNGQPVASSANRGTNSAPMDNPNRTSANGSGVPMHSIPGHQSSVAASSNHAHDAHGSTDNFDRSTYETRNQMRGASVDSGLTGRPGAMATTSELPGIRVVTHGPGSIMIRQTSQFEIRVENRGSIDAEGVLVRSTVPEWADLRGQNASIGNVEVREQGSGRQLVWTIDQLPAGTSERMFVRLTAARSGSYDLDVDWTLLPQKAVAKVVVHEPRLDLTIEGPDEVVYGESQTYKVHVLNPGDGTAPNVVFTLSPNSATPQTQRIGDIPPGKEAQFDVELTAQDLGDLKIHGLATGELDLRAEAAKTIQVSAAQLEAMLNGPELKYQNSDATYNLQVQNTGSVASNKILATLRLPTGVEYIDGIEGVAPQGNMLRWEITSLAPGVTRNYQFRCKMTSTGDHTFAFDCKGTAAGQTDVSLSTQVESIADLVLTVNDPTAPAPIGSDVTYEIVIRNRGSKEATDVRAVAQFSHGIEPQRIEGQSGEVVTGQVLFDPIGRIGAGQEVRLRVIAQAERGGHHRFRSEVRSGDTVLVAEEATHYMSPKSERVSRHSSDTRNR